MVAPGDTVAEEDPLITLESDKATMDVPSPAAGTIRDLSVAVGDTVSEGTLILTLDGAAAGGDSSGGDSAGGAKEHVEEDATPEPASDEPASYGSEAGGDPTSAGNVAPIGDLSDLPVIEGEGPPPDTL